MKKCTCFYGLLLALCLATSCAAPQAPLASGPKALPKSAKPVQPTAVAPAPLPMINLQQELMGTLVFKNLDALTQQAAAYVLPHLPPAVALMVKPEALKEQLFTMLELKDLMPMVDTSRPLALGLVDPMKFRGGKTGAVLWAVPVRPGQENAMIQVLTQLGTTPESWFDGRGFRLKINGSPLFLLLEDHWVIVSSHEALIRSAPPVLLPLVRQNSEEAALLHLHLDTIYEHYEKQINAALADLPATMQKNGNADTGKLILRWVEYLKGIKTLTLSLGLGASDIQIHFAALAKPTGAFQNYLSQLNPGAPWGADHLPKDSLFVGLGRDGESSIRDSLETAIILFKEALHNQVDEATVNRWHEVAQNVIKTYAGEFATGIWVTPKGGLGFGGITRIKKDAKEARQDFLQVWRTMEKDLSHWAQQLIQKGAKDEWKTWKIAMKVKPNGWRVAGNPCDLMEISVTWPKLKNKEEQKDLERIKRGLTRLLGPRWTLASTTLKDSWIVTGGIDYRSRMAEMVNLVQKSTSNDISEKLRSHWEGKDVVSLFYVPLLPMAQGIIKVIEQWGPFTKEVQKTLTQVRQALPAANSNTPVPVYGVVHVKPQQLLFDIDLSTDLIGVITKTIMNASTAMIQQ